MPDRLDMNADVLRRLAAEQEEAADRTRRWAKRPEDWLSGFLHNYGSIAAPVHRAMERYYDARERAGNTMAGEHERAARNLRAAAASYEEGDQRGARQTSQVQFGPDVSSPPPGGPGPAGPGPAWPSPVDPGPAGPAPDGPGPAGPGPAGPGPAGPGPVDSGPAAPPPDVPTEDTPPAAGVPFIPAVPGVPAVPVVPAPPASNGSVAPPPPAAAAGPAAAAPPRPAVVAPAVTAAPSLSSPPSPGVGPSAPVSAPATTTPPSYSGSSTAAAPPIPHAAPEHAADSSRVVSEPVNDDLGIARTLLAAVLAATESTVVGVSWAVAVLRGPSGAGVFITTNEGRGWLPAGLFLPSQVSTPWLWDEMLDNGTGQVSAVWEGIADPARVLVEFGRVWGPRAGAAITALVSSGPIDPRLRAQLGDVATEGLIAPVGDIDLRMPDAGTVDRLELTGSGADLDPVVALPDAQLRDRCVELAADAHMRLARTGPAPVEAAEMARLRDRILAIVQAGQEVPPLWWHELRDADELLAASLLTRRVDVAHVGVGDLRVADGADALRALVFQRRCTELVLLLEGDTGWQQVRDAVYAHEQVVEHPVFAAARTVVSAPESGRYERPVDLRRISAEPNERVVSSDINRQG
ncbi:type VII secretion target [Nocardia nepalensis]|uniref:type VII secretion target n=1 Tax=Nocardia nepalensis TaxID=3375448 RepID=UPI003B67F773